METEAEILLEEDEHAIERQVAGYLEAEDGEGLAKLLDSLSYSDALRQLLQLYPEDRDRLFSILPHDIAAELLREAPNELAVEMASRLDAALAAAILGELDSDIRADILGEMEGETADAIYATMTKKEAEGLRLLASYDDDVAGGIMGTEAFTFNKKDTVGNVLKRLAAEEEDFERYRGQHPYILNRFGKPVGVVSLRSLLTAKRSALLTEIMTPPMTVHVSTPLDDVLEIFDEHPFLGMPVVDDKGKLAGVISRAAADEAALERAENENLRLQGIVGEEVRSMPVILRSRRRLAWLSANIVLNIIAASVISAYEATLAAVIAIAVFLPMVSDMSGCSGNQAVAVTMRELSLGLVKPFDAFRVWLKEASVGIINGTVLGILIGLVAWVWKGNAYLGLVIGLALALNTLIAVSIGGVVPLLLKRFGQDPAVASGPLLTTVTDMAGFFLVLSLATLFMPMLI
jgi:magnesium transporter